MSTSAEPVSVSAVRSVAPEVVASCGADGASVRLDFDPARAPGPPTAGSCLVFYRYRGEHSLELPIVFE